MSSLEFIHWLTGFLDSTDGSLSVIQCDRIKNKMQEVTEKHTTPLYYPPGVRGYGTDKIGYPPEILCSNDSKTK